MNDRYDYLELESIVRDARMARSIALGNAISSLMARLSGAISRGIAAASRRSSGKVSGNATAPVHR